MLLQVFKAKANIYLEIIVKVYLLQSLKLIWLQIPKNLSNIIRVLKVIGLKIKNYFALMH